LKRGVQRRRVNQQGKRLSVEGKAEEGKRAEGQTLGASKKHRTEGTIWRNWIAAGRISETSACQGERRGGDAGEETAKAETEAKVIEGSGETRLDLQRGRGGTDGMCWRMPEGAAAQILVSYDESPREQRGKNKGQVEPREGRLKQGGSASRGRSSGAADVGKKPAKKEGEKRK